MVLFCIKVDNIASFNLKFHFNTDKSIEKLKQQRQVQAKETKKKNKKQNLMFWSRRFSHLSYHFMNETALLSVELELLNLQGFPLLLESLLIL